MKLLDSMSMVERQMKVDVPLFICWGCQSFQCLLQQGNISKRHVLKVFLKNQTGKNLFTPCGYLRVCWMLQVTDILETSPLNLSCRSCDCCFVWDSSMYTVLVCYMCTAPGGQAKQENRRTIASTAVQGNGNFMDNTMWWFIKSCDSPAAFIVSS